MASTIDAPQILFICGSPRQAEELHRIADELGDCRVWFTPCYGGPIVTALRELGLLERTVAGKRLGEECLRYLRNHHLPFDLGGLRGRYDLIVTSSDLVLPPNTRGHPLVVVGTSSGDRTVAADRLVWRIAYRMSRWRVTDPGNAPRRVCVAGQDDREFFLELGVPRQQIVVTGPPDQGKLGPAAAGHGSAAWRIAQVCRALLATGETERADSGLLQLCAA